MSAKRRDSFVTQIVVVVVLTILYLLASLAFCANSIRR